MTSSITLPRFLSVYFVFMTLNTTYGLGKVVDLEINLDEVIRKTNDKFLSVQFDFGEVSRHWDKVESYFESTLFLTLCKGLYPGYVRMGGTVGDMLHFQRDGSITPYKYSNITEVREDVYWDNSNEVGRQPFVKFNMTGEQFDKLHKFFSSSAKFKMVFGLNALIRIGAYWDPSNAVQFLDYSSERGYEMDFQLGNEPNDYHKYNFTVKPNDLGDDFLTLRKLLDTYPLYKTSSISGPDVTQPNKVKTYHFLDTVIKYASPVLDAITWHQYYMNGRIASLDDFLDPSLLDDLPLVIYNATHCAKNYKLDPVVWLGETASTYGGGTPGLSDRYVAGFMWLDKLGLCAKLGIDVVVRQCIIDGNYALIHGPHHGGSFLPNPDYWLSYLFKVLVGAHVLKATVSEHSESVRMYAHCTNLEKNGYPQGAVTVYGLNLLEESVTINLTPNLTGTPIEQFLLTPHQGELTSSFVDLNGKKLEMVDDTTFPVMEPLTVKEILLPARTFGFFVLPKAGASACSRL